MKFRSKKMMTFTSADIENVVAKAINKGFISFDTDHEERTEYVDVCTEVEHKGRHFQVDGRFGLSFYEDGEYTKDADCIEGSVVLLGEDEDIEEDVELEFPSYVRF